MFSMNLGEDDNFAFKHPYFFEDFTCKFEGWEPKLQKEFECFIKDLGGNVVDDATCIFTEYIYYSTQRENRNFYYSINFIRKSIETEVPLDLDKWRYINLELRENQVGLGCCCYDIRTILKAKAYHSDDFNNIVCTQCLKDPMLYPNKFDGDSMSEESCDDIQIHINKNSEISKSSKKSEANIISIDKWKRTKPINIKDLDMSSENSDEEPTDISERKRKRNKSFKSSTESSQSSCENIASTYRSFHATLKKKRRRAAVKKKSPEAPEVEVIVLKNNETREVEIITLDSEEPPLPQMQQGFPGKLMKDIDDWWFNLPPGYNPDPNYKERESKLPFPERDYVDNEKRMMIAFLVKNNLYDQFDKRSTWRKMHRDGYLRPRSIDSLKEQIKVILRNIERFDLPEDIEQKFLSLKLK